jgi:hypothetical protein
MRLLATVVALATVLTSTSAIPQLWGRGGFGGGLVSGIAEGFGSAIGQNIGKNMGGGGRPAAAPAQPAPNGMFRMIPLMDN